MTPKEKAKELVDNYTVVLLSRRGRSGIQMVLSPITAKQCALIAVDEILNSIIRKKYLVEIGEWIETSENNYWQQVKREIQSL